MQKCVKCATELPEGAQFCHMCGKKQAAAPRKNRKRANGSGSISKLSGKRSKPWIVRKNDVMIGTFASYKDAQKALDGIIDVNVTEKYNLSFIQVYELWFAEYARGSTKQGCSDYSAAVKRCSELHDIQFRKLRRSDFQSVIVRLEGEGKSKSTCQKVILLFRQLSNWAIDEGLIQANYALKVSTVAQQLSEREIFKDAQIQAIQKSNLPAKIITLILLGCGCRPNELFKVHTVNCFEDYFIGGSKTVAGKNRPIMISGVGLETYQQLRNKAIAEGCDRLIDAYDGNRVAANFTKRDFAELMEEIGCKGMTPYCCRHTFITNAVRSGVDQKMLRRIVGHVDEQTTEGYTHLEIRDLRNEVAKMSTGLAVCNKSVTKPENGQKAMFQKLSKSS